MGQERITVRVEDMPQALGFPTAWHGKMALFDRPDSLRLLDYCEGNGIGCLGAEGFRLEGKFIYPQMDYIADLSSLYTQDPELFVQKSIPAMRRFMQLVPEQGVFLEFVLMR